jgi:anti-anti-sigma factor
VLGDPHAVADAPALRITSHGDRPELVLAGEIDEFSYPDLAASLAHAVSAGCGDIHIDLGAVEYCDIAGLRAIVCAAGSPGEARPSRRVVLHSVPPQLRKVLRILGWDALPAVVVEEVRLAGAGLRPARPQADGQAGASGVPQAQNGHSAVGHA